MNSATDLKKQFSDCVEQNLASLYRVAERLTKHKDNAEDLVADTVVKAWSCFASLQQSDRFRPWIFRIMRNCYLDDCRKRKVRPVEQTYDTQDVLYDDDELLNTLFNQTDEFMFWWANPEIEIANNLLGKQINAAIDSLPDIFREVITLVNVEGLSYDEAAEVLSVPPGTIRSRMKRGRTLLQKALWLQAQESGLISQDKTMSERVGE